MKDQKNRMTNERDYKLDPNYVAPDPEKEKLLIKLAGMITDRYAAKLTHTIKPDDPEVWCLDEVLTKEEVKVMLTFKKTRVNVDLEELAQRNNMGVDEMKKIVDHLCWIGCVETNRENPDHHIQYDVPIICFY